MLVSVLACNCNPYPQFSSAGVSYWHVTASRNIIRFFSSLEFVMIATAHDTLQNIANPIKHIYYAIMLLKRASAFHFQADIYRPWFQSAQSFDDITICILFLFFFFRISFCCPFAITRKIKSMRQWKESTFQIDNFEFIWFVEHLCLKLKWKVAAAVI